MDAQIFVSGLLCSRILGKVSSDSSLERSLHVRRGGLVGLRRYPDRHEAQMLSVSAKRAMELTEN